MTSPPPPEWAPHEALWIGFPSDAALWLEDLEPTRAEVAAFAAAIHADGAGEQVLLVAADEAAAGAARRLAPFASLIVEPFGDVWLRDTAPVILGSGSARRAAGFRFNGWGGKFELAGDDDIGERLARRAALPFTRADWILEGGAIDGDGSGTLVTTEQCLLNPNRNPGLDRSGVEALLERDLGIRRVIWLGEGLIGDHTDGHVDNLARFVAAGVVAVPAASDDDDPNAAAFADAERRLRAAGLETVAIPSAGRISRDGEVVPASYMNFVIGNAAVVVPQFGAPGDQAAVAAIAALFPGRRTVGIRCDHLLTGGGSFHCISQQLPA